MQTHQPTALTPNQPTAITPRNHFLYWAVTCWAPIPLTSSLQGQVQDEYRLPLCLRAAESIQTAQS